MRCARTLVQMVAAAAVIAAVSSGVRAQLCGQWRPGLTEDGRGGGIAGVNGQVTGMTTWDPDGDGPRPPVLVLSGPITVAGDASVRGLAAWDGQAWGAFPGPLPLLPAGSTSFGVLGSAGGWLFAVVTTRTDPRLLALDGAAWRDLGAVAGPSPTVAAVVEYNGLPIVVGSFTSIGGVPANNIAAWDGAAWRPLGIGCGGGGVRAAAVYTGRLVVGGGFTSAGGVPANRVAAWDGAAWAPLDSGLPAAGATTAEVISLAADATGLYAAGPISLTPTSYPRSTFMRYTGVSWTAMPQPMGLGVGPSDPASVISHAGRVYFIGRFFGVPEDRQSGTLAVATFDGTSWSVTKPILPMVDRIATPRIWAASFGQDLALAASLSIASAPPKTPVRLFRDGVWRAAGDGLDGPVRRFLTLGNGDIVAVGQFTAAGGELTPSGVARWDGVRWRAMGSELGFDLQNPLPMLAVKPAVVAGELYVIATFGSIYPRSIELARWNGSSWARLSGPVPGRVPGAIGSFRGRLVAATSIPPSTAGRVAQLGPTGWEFVPGDFVVAPPTASFDQSVSLHEAGGRLFVTGPLASVGGVPVARIAAWDGQAWTAMDSGLPSSERVEQIVAAGDDVYARTSYSLYRWTAGTWSQASQVTLGGYSTAATGIGDSLWIAGTFGLMRADANAARRAYAGPGSVQADAIVQRGETVAVSATFSYDVAGQPLGSIARWVAGGDGPTVSWLASARVARESTQVLFPLALSGYPPYRLVRVTRDGVEQPASSSGRTFSLYATALGISRVGPRDAGDYVVTVANGCGEATTTTSIRLDVTCAADMNLDGRVDLADLTQYIDAWFGQRYEAEFDGRGGVDLLDLFAWIDRWLAGC